MEDEQSTTVETPDEPANDPILDSLNDTEDTSVDDGVDETSDNSEDEAEAEPEAEQSEDEEIETDPKEEARRRYEERQRVQAERRDRVQNQTEDYVKQSDDEYDQRLRAMEVQQYSALIENNENTLIGEFERAKVNPDLQIFNPENREQFNQRAYDKALRDYNAGYLEYDQNGNMTGIKGSLYEHLTETAELYQGAVKTGQVQQVRATRRMKSNADSKPAASPKETTKDTIMDILKSD